MHFLQENDFKKYFTIKIDNNFDEQLNCFYTQNKSGIRLLTMP